MDQIENLYNPGTVSDAAKFHGAVITFSESNEHVTISAQATEEYGRNYRFWQWLFNITMRNPLMTGRVYSCEFLPPFRRPAIPIEACVDLTISVHDGIVLQLSKAEFHKLKSLGAWVEEVKGDAFPYRLRLGGNVLSVKLKK